MLGRQQEQGQPVEKTIKLVLLQNSSVPAMDAKDALASLLLLHSHLETRFQIHPYPHSA